MDDIAIAGCFMYPWVQIVDTPSVKWLIEGIVMGNMLFDVSLGLVCWCHFAYMIKETIWNFDEWWTNAGLELKIVWALEYKHVKMEP